MVEDFRLPTVSGAETTLADLLAPGLPVFLVSLSPGCGPCKRLRPDVAQWAKLLSDQLTVAVLAPGTAGSNTASYADVPHLPVLVDEDGAVRQSLGTTATPSAVLVGPDRRLASGVAHGETLVRRLLVSVLTGTHVDESVPEPESGTLEGTPADEIDLSSAVGPRPTVQTHALGESTVLLDSTSGATLVLDPIGAVVWSVLDGASPLGEIVADIAEVFEAPVAAVGTDVLELVRTLGRSGLLAGSPPSVGTLAPR